MGVLTWRTAAAVGAVGSGVLWVGQVFVPWARSGALSASSGLDVWHLSRAGLLTGDLDRVVPGLWVLPVLGTCALALSGFAGPVSRRARIVVMVGGLACSAALLLVLGGRLDGRGTGQVLTGVAALLALLVVVSDLVVMREAAPAVERETP